MLKASLAALAVLIITASGSALAEKQDPPGSKKAAQADGHVATWTARYNELLADPDAKPSKVQQAADQVSKYQAESTAAHAACGC